MSDVKTTPMRDALAWATNDTEKAQEPSTNPFVWLWEAIEGDFNDDRSASQILVDAAISMIPLVDQLCDVRDLIANVRKLSKDATDKANWLALALTLIGLFPTLGSLVKGVLKIIFTFARHKGAEAVGPVVDAAMTWVVTFLRRREVQRYLTANKVDDVFRMLAAEIKKIKGQVNASQLTSAFDRGIKVVDGLVAKVSHVPVLGGKARATLLQLQDVRKNADQALAEAIRPINEYLEATIQHLERRALAHQRGIVNVANVHFRGTLPEEAAVTLMKRHDPTWLSKAGDEFFPSVNLPATIADVRRASARFDATGKPRDPSEVYPALSEQSILSFHTIAKHTVVGPARLYRIIGPNSRAMSDCWMSEEVFKKLQDAPDPKAAWREHLGVWPYWNPDGQFVIYDVKPGEKLNVWRGRAASQENDSLPGRHLKGGGEQIVFNLERRDPRHDTMLYFRIDRHSGAAVGPALTQDQFNAARASMSRQEQAAFDAEHLCIREQINHPNISGPFETGWGYTDFDGESLPTKIGLPSLPGQLTSIRR